MTTNRSKTPRRADAAQLAARASSCPAPASAGALAAGSPAARPVINVQVQGSNNIVNLGGHQYIGNSQINSSYSSNAVGGADTTRGLLDTIAAQQRTIDHLITMLERLTAALR